MKINQNVDIFDTMVDQHFWYREDQPWCRHFWLAGIDLVANIFVLMIDFRVIDIFDAMIDFHAILIFDLMVGQPWCQHFWPHDRFHAIDIFGIARINIFDAMVDLVVKQIF